MILLPRAVRVYFATGPASLRKSFEGLSNEVRAVLGRDPLSGHVFVFLNRRRTQVKLLLWTRGGFTIVHKRLERGTFCFPAQATDLCNVWRSSEIGRGQRSVAHPARQGASWSKT